MGWTQALKQSIWLPHLLEDMSGKNSAVPPGSTTIGHRHSSHVAARKPPNLLILMARSINKPHANRDFSTPKLQAASDNQGTITPAKDLKLLRPQNDACSGAVHPKALQPGFRVALMRNASRQQQHAKAYHRQAPVQEGHPAREFVNWQVPAPIANVQRPRSISEKPSLTKATHIRPGQPGESSSRTSTSLQTG
jgi:hypothetical protein